MGTEPVLLAGGAVHQPLTASDLRYPPIAVPKEDTVANEKVYMPKQHVRRGTAGYKEKKGVDVVVVDDDGKPEPKKK